ncbi:MAG: ATP-binding protein, partial [Firmicutes bacterium]|nr:ATP-binding protein [Bacillota bacterium]
MKKAEVRKYNKISVTVGVLFVILLFAVCVAIAGSIFKTVSEELYSERRQSLNEVSEQISKTVDAICSYSWYISDAAFSHILSSEIEKKEDLSALLSEAESGLYNSNYYLTVIDSQTYFYLSNGNVGLFRNIEFLKNSANSRQVVITSVTFYSDKEYMLFLRRLDTPLILKDGTQITHTVMVLSPEVYSSAFFCSGYGGSADIFIIHEDGRSIYRRNNTETFSTAANIMRILENVRFLHGGSFEDLKESLIYPTGESFEFEYEDEKYFVSFAPISTPDWDVVLIMPTDQMNSGYESLLSAAMYRIFAMCLIGVLIIAMIIYFLISAVNMRIREAQQKQLNDALKKVAEEANSANRAKSEFLSHMSHDLRTPLNVILGMLEIAEESPDITEELKNCLFNIHSASNHLSALINDVLDMSRLESSLDTPAEKMFDMRTVMDACCSVIHSSADRHNIIFTYQCSGFQHPYLIGCELCLRKVLINVLGNAVKFTDDGGSVTFEAEEIACEYGTASFRFIVSDTGIGMKEGFREHIFEPFWQENDSARTNYEGTGLGMSIVKKLVDKMGGTIDVYSKFKEGSRFTIVLPFSVSENAFETKDDTEKMPLPASSLKGMTVLLCDDNILNCNIAEHFLKKADAAVIIANNGEEAIEKFKNSDIGSIDVILMDVMMPVIDGLEATKRIRSLSRSDAASIPIVSMTANAFEEDVKKTLAAGMNEHLSKPINGKMLIS